MSKRPQNMPTNDIITDMIAGGITFLIFGFIASIFSKSLGIFLYTVAGIWFLLAIAKKIDARDEKPSIDDSQNKTIYVYITDTGKKYHYEKECAGAHSKLVPLVIAESKRYRPCKKCTYH